MLDEKSKQEMKENIILSTVENSDGCWLWIKSCFSSGYGQQKWKGTNYKAHRLAYNLFVGEIADGLIVRHLCGNRRCCNPLHLGTGTLKDNSEDMRLHGRSYFHNIDQTGTNNHNSILSESDIIEILEIKSLSKISNAEIARMFNVSRKTIDRVISGNTYRNNRNAV